MQNWIDRNRTVLKFKLRTHAKLNCLKSNCFWHWNCATLNWVIRNRSVLTFKCVQTKTMVQFSISMQLVLFNPLIGPYQVLQFRARVDSGVMKMKGCSAFSKALASLEHHHQIVSHHIQDTHWGEEILTQSVYSTAPADWAKHNCLN